MNHRMSFQTLCSILCGTMLFVCTQAAADIEVIPDCALIIGIAKYDEHPSLLYADRDAGELAEALIAGGFDKRDVVVMADDAEPPLRPTAGNIRLQLQRLAKFSGETVFVAFSGHGTSSSRDDEVLLAPSDASKEHSSMIPLAEIFQALASCDAKLKLIVLDSLSSREKPVAPPDGVVVLTASSPGEVSFESDKLKHGVFSHYVIQALRGAADFDHDGSITIPEVELYTKRHVARHSQRLHQRTQMPCRVGIVYGLPSVVTLPWCEPREVENNGRSGSTR